MADNNLKDVYRGSIFDMSTWGKQPYNPGKASGRADLIPTNFTAPKIAAPAVVMPKIPSPVKAPVQPYMPPVTAAPKQSSFGSLGSYGAASPASDWFTNQMGGNISAPVDSWNQITPDTEGFASQMGNGALTYATGATNPASSLGGGLWDSLKSFMSGAVGTKETPGWGGLALGTVNSLLGGYLGMQQYGLAKDSFKRSQYEFDKEYKANQDLTNGQLRDQHAARLANNADYAGKLVQI